MESTPTAPQQFDLFEGRALRDHGMAQAWDSDDTAAKAAALQIIKDICLTQGLLNADDFHRVAADRQVRIKPKSVGSIWKVAMGNGWCEQTGRIAHTTRKVAHSRTVPEYRSLLFRRDGCQ